MKFETLFFSVHDEKKYHFNACVCARACRGSNMSESKSGKTALNDDGTHFTITAKFENIDEKSKPKSTNQGKLKWLLNKISSLGTRTVFFSSHIFSGLHPRHYLLLLLLLLLLRNLNNHTKPQWQPHTYTHTSTLTFM